MGKKKRISLSNSMETEILINSRRRCALCVYLKNDFGEKELQIAHIDDDPANNDPDNLIALCLDHHVKIHQKNPISKGFKHNEIKYYRNLLHKNISNILETNTLNQQDVKDQIKQNLVKSFEKGDFRLFYKSIFDFGFEEITKLLHWTIIEKYDDYFDGINIIKLTIDKGPSKDIKLGDVIFCGSGSEYYRIEFSPTSCQVLYDVRQFSWFNKKGKPIFSDAWESHYNGSLMQMYYNHEKQQYEWQSFERPDIKDYSKEVKNSILEYLKEKLDV